MSGTFLQIGLYLLAAGVLGGVSGWFARGIAGKHSLEKLNDKCTDEPSEHRLGSSFKPVNPEWSLF